MTLRPTAVDGGETLGFHVPSTGVVANTQAHLRWASAGPWSAAMRIDRSVDLGVHCECACLLTGVRVSTDIGETQRSIGFGSSVVALLICILT